MHDTYAAIIRRLVEQGATPLEALRSFDRSLLDAAMLNELEEGGRVLLDLVAAATREEMNERDMDQAIDLWLSGWKSETPSSTQVDVMSWYWRSPAKTGRAKGRLYRSTNQAWRALRRMGGDNVS